MDRLAYSLYMGKGSDRQAESNDKVYARIKQIYIDQAAIQNEWILIMSNNKPEAWQGDHIPPSFGGGSRLQPLQEQVDEYEFIGNEMSCAMAPPIKPGSSTQLPVPIKLAPATQPQRDIIYVNFIMKTGKEVVAGNYISP